MEVNSVNHESLLSSKVDDREEAEDALIHSALHVLDSALKPHERSIPSPRQSQPFHQNDATPTSYTATKKDDRTPPPVIEPPFMRSKIRSPMTLSSGSGSGSGSSSITAENPQPQPHYVTSHRVGLPPPAPSPPVTPVAAHAPQVFSSLSIQNPSASTSRGEGPSSWTSSTSTDGKEGATLISYKEKSLLMQVVEEQRNIILALTKSQEHLKAQVQQQEEALKDMAHEVSIYRKQLAASEQKWQEERDLLEVKHLKQQEAILMKFSSETNKNRNEGGKGQNDQKGKDGESTTAKTTTASDPDHRRNHTLAAAPSSDKSIATTTRCDSSMQTLPEQASCAVQTSSSDSDMKRPLGISNSDRQDRPDYSTSWLDGQKPQYLEPPPHSAMLSASSHSRTLDSLMFPQTFSRLERPSHRTVSTEELMARYGADARAETPGRWHSTATAPHAHPSRGILHQHETPSNVRGVGYDAIPSSSSVVRDPYHSDDGHSTGTARGGRGGRVGDSYDTPALSTSSPTKSDLWSLRYTPLSSSANNDRVSQLLDRIYSVQ